MPARAVLPLMLVRSAGLPFARLEALSADFKTGMEAIRVGHATLSECTADLQAHFDASLSVLPDAPLRTAVYNARKTFFQHQRPPAPALEAQLAECAETSDLLQALRRFRAAEQALRVAEAALAALYTETLHAGYRQLQDIARGTEFQRALLFSSHALLGQLPRFAETPVEQFAKKERQTALAVLQYATRMATKTIPLSRFVTVAIGSAAPTGSSDSLEMPDFGKVVVAPNVAVLEALYAVLLNDPTFFRALPVVLNPCIADVPPDAYSWLFFNGEQESFQQVEASPALDYIVGLLLEQRRQLPFDWLTKTVADATGIEQGQAEAYLLELTDIGFLEWALPETGLSADWCSGLYRFLGFLSAEPLIVDTAALLQWLRSAARALPYQPIAAAMATQHAAAEQVQQYFERWGAPVPPVPPEQLFYEDVASDTAEAGGLAAAIPLLLDQLADAWRSRPERPLPGRRAAFAAFLMEKIQPGETGGFLELAQAFLLQKSKPSKQAHPCRESQAPQQVGALLQFFWENDRPHAVVNALYPGGGKMFARWLHLFPQHARQTLRDWLASLNAWEPSSARPASKHAPQNARAAFPWQGYFNANFQPPLADAALAVPGGRVRAVADGRPFLLGNLEVALENGCPVLRDRATGQALDLTDLGLEAVETRPPVMQLLWQIGVPYVSRDAMLPESGAWQYSQPDISYRPRCQFDALVLARAAWVVGARIWQTWQLPGGQQPSARSYWQIRETLSALGVPRHFFAHTAGERAQAFDQDSPLSMVLFQKMLRQGTTGSLHLSEMLPVPTASAEEWVVEIAV